MARGFVELFRSIFKVGEAAHEKMLPVELDISSGNSTTTIYARTSTASILGSVFAAPKGGGQAIRLPGGALDAPPAQSVSSKIRIGEELRAAKDKIAAHGRHLASLGDRAIADYVETTIAMSEAQICNIAVLGQMNAGKSTLINTFVERHNLLPAEITPWTTVVTNLHFGVPNAPKAGASFDFFDADEWQRLAEGSTRLRELTERLIPNFDWTAFYRQVGDMREKARQKLGPQFEDLLGGQHSFAELTPGLLRKYVCAEPPIEGPDEFGTGEFSLITKAANLYFDMGGFFYPTLVIDTPGINDPFLVRDEITRQNLERANIFIIVVTARQPLSNADVDLLRILRGLDKDRIIVFVNKIDEVEDFAEFETAILKRVRGVLEKEFPGARIPIIMGSARWAADILSGEDTPLPVIPAPLRPSAREIAAQSDEGRTFWSLDPAMQELLAAEDVLMRSGIPGLALAVSEMMQSGPIADSLRFSAAALAGVASNCAAFAEAEAELAAQLMESRDGAGAAGTGEAAQLQARLAEIKAATDAIGGIIEETRQAGKASMAGGFARLRERLSERLEGYLAQMSVPGGEPTGVQGGQSVNVMPLRAALETEFVHEFVRIHAGMIDMTLDAESRIRQQTARLREQAGVALAYSPLPALKLAPPLGALGDPIALASGGTVQAQWLRQQMPPEERAHRFRELIRLQFQAIIERLCEDGRREIDRAAGFTIDHFRMSVLHGLKGGSQAWQARLDAHLQAHGAPPVPAMPLEDLRAKAADCRRIALELAALAARPEAQ